MPTYERVKKFNLFAQKDKDKETLPDFKNGKVILDVDWPKGRYSISGWQYADTGNISLDVQRVIEDEQTGGGFDD